MDSFSADTSLPQNVVLLDVAVESPQTETPIAALAIDDALGDVTDTLGGLVDQFNAVKVTVEDLNNELQLYLNLIQSGLDAQILSRTLPLIGDDLEDAAGDAVQFLDNLSNQVTAQLLRLDGFTNLSGDRIRQSLIEVLTEQGALAIEKLVPESVSEPFVTALQNALTGDQSIEDSLESALESALTELDQLGLLGDVLPNDLSSLLDGKVIRETLLELGETALKELDATQLQRGLVDAIAALGVANLTEFLPPNVVTSLQADVAAALNGGSFGDLESAVQSALTDLSGQLSQVPTAADVLAAAGLDAANFNQLGAGGTLQKILSGLNQLDALNLDGVLPVADLLQSFQGQLAAANSVPEALTALLSSVETSFPQLFSSVPSAEELLTAAVPALINERLAGLSPEQIAATFSPQQGLQGLLIAVNELDLLDLEALIPDGVIGDVIDRVQSLILAGGSLSDALTSGLELALNALNEAGVLPVAIPSIENLQNQILPLLNGDQIENLSADQFRSIMFQGLSALEGLGLPEFIPTEVLSALGSTFASELDGDASVAEALRSALGEALPALEAAGSLVGNRPM